MRIDEVFKNNCDLKKLPLNTEDGRQKAMLSVMTDVSETLAMLLDIYGIVHGREIRSGNNHPQGTPPQQGKDE